MFPEAKPRGTLRIEGKQNSLFDVGPVIECFVIPPDSKIEQIKLIYVSKELRSVFSFVVSFVPYRTLIRF